MSGDWRVIAQRVLTGEFLSMDLPLNGATTIRELSGPGGISGTIEPELTMALADDGRPIIEEWSTALYVDRDGEITAGGIVTSLDFENTALQVNAPGFAAYPNGQPFLADYFPDEFEDPVDTFKAVWDHLQSYPDGNLGMTVVGDSTYMVLSNGSGPYRILLIDTADCGEQLASIAQVAPFDFAEKHRWNAAKTAIAHTIEVGFPRLGRKRDDLRFVAGENVVSISTIQADGEKFANEVYFIGQGSGPTVYKASAAVRDGRLRRATVVTKKAATQGLTNLGARAELRAREMKLDISEVTINDDPNARISAIQPGDDVLVDVEVPWLGHLKMWLRVLSIEESADNAGRATLKTQRSDSFTYAAGTNPNTNGDPVVVIL